MKEEYTSLENYNILHMVLILVDKLTVFFSAKDAC